MSDHRPARPKKPFIIALVVLAGLLVVRAVYAADVGLDRGGLWALLAAVVALGAAGWFATQRARATRRS